MPPILVSHSASLAVGGLGVTFADGPVRLRHAGKRHLLHQASKVRCSETHRHTTAHDTDLFDAIVVDEDEFAACDESAAWCWNVRHHHPATPRRTQPALPVVAETRDQFPEPASNSAVVRYLGPVAGCQRPVDSAVSDSDDAKGNLQVGRLLCTDPVEQQGRFADGQVV